MYPVDFYEKYFYSTSISRNKVYLGKQGLCYINSNGFIHILKHSEYDGKDSIVDLVVKRDGNLKGCGIRAIGTQRQILTILAEIENQDISRLTKIEV